MNTCLQYVAIWIRVFFTTTESEREKFCSFFKDRPLSEFKWGRAMALTCSGIMFFAPLTLNLTVTGLRCRTEDRALASGGFTVMVANTTTGSTRDSGVPIDGGRSFMFNHQNTLQVPMRRHNLWIAARYWKREILETQPEFTFQIFSSWISVPVVSRMDVWICVGHIMEHSHLAFTHLSASWPKTSTLKSQGLMLKLEKQHHKTTRNRYGKNMKRVNFRAKEYVFLSWWFSSCGKSKVLSTNNLSKVDWKPQISRHCQQEFVSPKKWSTRRTWYCFPNNHLSVVPTPLKNISQIGSSSQLNGKIQFMFQTTKQ